GVEPANHCFRRKPPLEKRDDLPDRPFRTGVRDGDGQRPATLLAQRGLAGSGARARPFSAPHSGHAYPEDLRVDAALADLWNGLLVFRPPGAVDLRRAARAGFDHALFVDCLSRFWASFPR